MLLLEALALALGGALGGFARALVSAWITLRTGERFPWGTLSVNLSGAFLAGAIFGAQASAKLPPGWAHFLLGGLLGGYTTVSSLALQALSLFESSRRREAVGFLLSHLAFGVPLAALGWWLARHA